MNGCSTQEEWEKEERYLDQYTGQKKRVRQVYDPEVREYLVKLGMLEDLLTGNYRLIMRPAKFEDRKQVDYEIYQQMRDDNTEIRSQSKLTTTDEDKAIFYMNWLNERVEAINNELSKTDLNGKKKPSTGTRQIAATELYKYRKYLESEIKTVIADIEILNNHSSENAKDITTSTSNNQSLAQHPQPWTDEEKCGIVKKILSPLSGTNPQRQTIMSSTDYDRLIRYTIHLALTDNLPTDIVPISQTNISSEHIRYTFYLLHKELWGTHRIKQDLINFLHVIFRQFKGTSSKTTRSKFSTPPKSYIADFAG